MSVEIIGCGSSSKYEYPVKNICESCSCFGNSAACLDRRYQRSYDLILDHGFDEEDEPDD